VTERVLVTGAAGFIGSHTCGHLLERGLQVIGVDNFDPHYDRTVKERWLALLRGRQGFRFVELDVRAREPLEGLLPDVDAVVHLAARPGVRSSFEAAGAHLAINVGGTSALLRACARAEVERVVVASSSSVYGEGVPAPFSESATDLSPISPYALSKLAAERLWQVGAEKHGLRVAALRFFSVYGPRQRPDQAIMRFTHQLAGGGLIRQFGNARSTRDYTHVDDAVRGVVAALEWTSAARPVCEIFNIGSGRPVELREVIRLVGQALGVKPRVRKVSRRKGDARVTHADISKARETLHFEPRVDIEDGVAQFVTWYEETYGRQSRATA
jgi:UDP-glucuronate 4-epimerase